MYFQQGPKEETISVKFNRKDGFMISQRTKFDEIKDSIATATSECDGLKDQLFTDCVANLLQEDIVKISDSKDQLTKYRDLISSRLRNYTCSDLTMNSSEPISTETFSYANKRYKVDVIFNTPHAKIWAVHDFVSDDECAHFMKYGQSRLRRATVAAEDGTSTVSPHRKAQQAGYDLQTRPNDPLW